KSPEFSRRSRQSQPRGAADCMGAKEAETGGRCCISFSSFFTAKKDRWSGGVRRTVEGSCPSLHHLF
ncbi:unnamed protein product, partial [Musa banksii]